MSPMMDMSEALTDPVTLDSFTLYRRKQIVDIYGETKMSYDIQPNIRGVVTPASKNDLDRKADSQIQTKSIEIITRFAIRGESQTVGEIEYQPDVVVWNGDSFLVKRVDDFSNYGRGFVLVICESIDIVDLPTTAEPLSPVPVPVTGGAGYGIQPYGEGEYGGDPPVDGYGGEGYGEGPFGNE